jgi:hypothetical protein
MMVFAGETGVGKIRLGPVTLMLAIFGGSAASAESLTVSGWYAADNRDVAMLQSLGVDRFEGDNAPQLASAIEGTLSERRDRDGGPYFTVRSRYGKAEGMVYGSMRVRVDLQEFTRKAKRCAADTTSKKCKDDEKIEVDIYCTRRIVSATANIKVTRLSDDRLIYNRSLPGKNETESCDGDSRPPSVESVVTGISRSIANDFASEVTPYGSTEKIRIRESRKGMAKQDDSQMKSLIAATKTSEAAACAGWKEMEARGITHPTLTFNLGLCAESAGELETALGYYRRLSNATDALDSIRRVERRMAGEDDDAERNPMPPAKP